MLATCFSMVPSDTTSLLAIAALDRPSAMRESTSLSRALSTDIVPTRLEAPKSWVTTSGSSAVPSGSYSGQRFDELAYVGDAIFQ